MIQAVWIEIPVKNVERAAKFYEAVFQVKGSEVREFGGRRTVNLFFDETMAKPGISLNQTTNFEPSDHGIFVYLDAGEDLTDALNRVEAAGGKILAGKTSMGADGFYAPILDTEGNQLALYSVK